MHVSILPQTPLLSRLLHTTEQSSIELSKFGGGVLPWWLSGKEPACQCRRHRFNPGLGRSLKKEMAIHSNILAWEIPWTEGPVDYTVCGVQLSD